MHRTYADETCTTCIEEAAVLSQEGTCADCVTHRALAAIEDICGETGPLADLWEALYRESQATEALLCGHWWKEQTGIGRKVAHALCAPARDEDRRKAERLATAHHELLSYVAGGRR